MQAIRTTDQIGPDADPALFADRPMVWPPTGNPRLFGPGRGRLTGAMIVAGGAA